MTERYVPTLTALLGEMDITKQAFHNTWANKPGFPTKTAKGWPVVACLEYVRDHKARKAQDMGAGSDKARASLRKIELQCEELEAKIAVIKRESIPIEEHNAEIEQVARIMLAGLDQFVQEVAAHTKDAELLVIAEKVRDRMKAQLEGML